MPQPSRVPGRFAAENATEQRCRYFAKAQKFLCRVKVPPGTEDTKPLVVSTCVSNAAGGSAGEDRIITLSSVRECQGGPGLAEGTGAGRGSPGLAEGTRTGRGGPGLAEGTRAGQAARCVALSPPFPSSEAGPPHQRDS